MCAETDDIDRFIEADLAFHAAILRATDNELLDQLVAAVGAGMRLTREVQASTRPVGGLLPGDPLPLHEAVMTAVRAGDGRAAEAAMAAVVKGASHDAEAALAAASSA